MKKNRKNKKVLNEPDVTIKKLSIQIFNSFEEASLSEQSKVLVEEPLQRIAQTVELILRTYGFSRETLLKRKPDNKIIIIK